MGSAFRNLWLNCFILRRACHAGHNPGDSLRKAKKTLLPAEFFRLQYAEWLHFNPGWSLALGGTPAGGAQ